MLSQQTWDRIVNEESVKNKLGGPISLPDRAIKDTTTSMCIKDGRRFLLVLTQVAAIIRRVSMR